MTDPTPQREREPTMDAAWALWGLLRECDDDERAKAAIDAFAADLVAEAVAEDRKKRNVTPSATFEAGFRSGAVSKESAVAQARADALDHHQQVRRSMRPVLARYTSDSEDATHAKRILENALIPTDEETSDG